MRGVDVFRQSTPSIPRVAMDDSHWLVTKEVNDNTPKTEVKSKIETKVVRLAAVHSGENIM